MDPECWLVDTLGHVEIVPSYCSQSRLVQTCLDRVPKNRKESKRMSKNPKESQRIPKVSQRIPKNLKEPRRIHKESQRI